MPKYQIIFNRGGGSKSYAYFDADPNEKPEEKAAEVATEYIEKQYSNQRMFSSFKAPRTVSVVEYDNDKKWTKRGGHKFKLELVFFQATFTSGNKKRNEWYRLKT